MSTRRPTVRLLVVLVPLLVSGCAPPPAEVISAKDMQTRRPGATALVVVYSRTGNTARAGRARARELGADYQRLMGPDKAGDSYVGTPHASERVEIRPRIMDLKQYRLVLLGTPIWFWKPTAMIHTFVESNRLDGKRVVLFYTFEGGVTAGALEAWKKLVRDQGGVVADLFGINRKKLAPGETPGQRAAKIAAERKARWQRTPASAPSK